MTISFCPRRTFAASMSNAPCALTVTVNVSSRNVGCSADSPQITTGTSSRMRSLRLCPNCPVIDKPRLCLYHYPLLQACVLLKYRASLVEVTVPHRGGGLYRPLTFTVD